MSGQAATEFLIALMLVVLPFTISVGFGLKQDWEKSKCTYQALQEARAQVIQTRRRATVSRSCGDSMGNLSEKLTLLSLEELDQDKGSLGIADLQSEVSRYWDRFSSWRSAQSAPGSSKSGNPSAIDPSGNSTSTVKPEPQSSL